MTLFRAVAWDIDGTLIDSEPLHQRGLVAASADFGVDLSGLDPEAFRGVHARDIWQALKPRFAPGAKFETWIAAIEGYYVAHAGELGPSRRHRGDAQTCGAWCGASLRVEFGANNRRRQHRGAGHWRDHRVLAQPDDVFPASPIPNPSAKRLAGSARGHRQRSPLKTAAQAPLGARGRALRCWLCAFGRSLRRRRPIDRTSRRSSGAIRGLTTPRLTAG